MVSHLIGPKERLSKDRYTDINLPYQKNVSKGKARRSRDNWEKGRDDWEQGRDYWEEGRDDWEKGRDD